MPKHKWNRLHDDATIDEERRRRSQSLKEQQEARTIVEEAIVEVTETREPAVQTTRTRR